MIPSPAIGRLRGVEPTLLAVGALLLAVMATGAYVSDRFASVGNLMTVAEQAAPLGFVALGQTLVVLSGGIDLSVGAVATAAAVLLAATVDGNGAIVVPALVGVLAAGAAVGAANGLIAVRTGVHPLIVTLGTSTVLTGVVFLYTLQPTGKVPFWFEEFAFGRVLGLPVAGLVMALAFVAVGLLLTRTPLGRALYAVGGNAEAARLSGIDAGRVVVFAYAASGFFAALAGAYLVSRTGVGDPRAGDALTLASIAPVIIGGTILGGGRGGTTGTLLGVLLLSLLGNLLNYMNVSTFIQWVLQGLVIIAAVSLHAGRGGAR